MKGLSPIGFVIALAFFASPFFVFPGLSEYADLPQTVAVFGFASLAMVTWALLSLRRRAIFLPPLSITVEAAAFTAWSFLSLAWAQNRYLALSDAAHFLSCFLILFLIAAERRGMIPFLPAAASLLVAWTAASLLGTAQALFHVNWVEQSVTPSSLFANRNMAAQYAGMALPLALAGMVIPGSLLRRAAAFAGAAAALLFILFTGTRAVILSMVILFLLIPPAMIHLLAGAGRKEGPSAKAAAILFAALIALPMITAPVLTGRGFLDTGVRPLSRIGSELKASGTAPTSPQVRLALWKNGIEMAKDHVLLGVGGGNFEVFYPLYHRAAAVDRLFDFDRKARFVHNEYLQVLIDYGAVGLFLYLVFLVSLLGGTVRLARSARRIEIRLIALGLGGMVLVYSVFSFFSFPLHRSMPPLLLAFAGGFLASFDRAERGSGTARRLPLRFAAGAVLVALTVTVGAVGAYGAISVLRSDLHYNNALTAERRGEWKQALDEGIASNRACRRRVDGLAVAGAAALKLGDPAKAARLLEKVLERRPWHTNTLLNLGVALTASGSPEKGARYTAAVVSLQPENGRARANLGFQYLRGDEPSRAVEQLSAAIERGGDGADVRTSLGIALHRIGKERAAEEAFEKALEIDEGYGPAHRSLAALCTGVFSEPVRGAFHARRYEEIEKDSILVKIFRNEMKKIGPGEVRPAGL